MDNNKTFCEIHSAYHGEVINSVDQLEQRFTGKELADFCEFYFKQRVEKSSLQHFDIHDKADLKVCKLFYFFLGFVACVVAVVVNHLLF
jgi:hypothetical protein